MQDMQVKSLGWKIPWRRKWQPTPVFFWKFYGHRSLGGYCPWGHKESSTTEHTHRKTGRDTHTHIFNFRPGVTWVAVQKHRFPVFLLQGRSILLYSSWGYSHMTRFIRWNVGRQNRVPGLSLALVSAYVSSVPLPLCHRPEKSIHIRSLLAHCLAPQ